MSDLEPAPPPPPAERASPLAPGSILGRDPFENSGGASPFVERLDALQSRLPRDAAPLTRSGPVRAPELVSRRHTPSNLAQPAGRPKPAQETKSHGANPQRTERIARLSRRRWSTTPTLREIDLPEPKGWADRFLSRDERRRLAALSHLIEGEGLYDHFGFSPDTIKNVFPIFHALYRLYFRVSSEGHENIPSEGPVVLAGNHAGLLPFDAAMGILDVILHTDPPRLARTIVDRWAGALPFVNIFYARVGQVVGTRENFANLLDDGQLVMVFPEGVEGIRKTITQRYRLQPFHVGFVENALRARVPIIPTAFVGSDDQTPILYNLKPLARLLGLPVVPITPTFPWLGPLGLLPYPVHYHIVYGQPLRYHERFGPEDANDSRLVRYLANQVRRAIQTLIDRNRR